MLWSQRVGDNLGRVKFALESALSRSDVVILCGGLGPTDDDLTREAIAAVVGETPTVDAGLEQILRDRFAGYGMRTFPEKNLKQAWLIPSAEALPNPQGTAPGWFVRTTVGDKPKWLVALPGPPRELVLARELQQMQPRELKVGLLEDYRPQDYRGDVWLLTERDAGTRIDGSRNDLTCTGLEHKLGIHASPTCTMLFDGADDFEMGSFQDGHGGQIHECDSLIHENLPFLFMH